MHEFEASDALICLIQEVFMEICREEDRSGGANEGGRRRKGGGRERGEKGLFFVLDLGLVGPLYLAWGIKISGPEIPARETHSRSLIASFPFLDVGGWSRGIFP
jgi:hypothetical protein